MADFFDTQYRAKSNVLASSEQLINSALRLLQPGATALEFGAGQGQNAAIVAKAGFDILATDILPIAVEQINLLAKDLDLSNLHGEVMHLNADINLSYDLIICIRAIHYVLKQEGYDFIEKIKTHTKPGGVNLLTVITTNGDFAKLPNAEKYAYFEEGEIKDLYSDWKVIEYQTARTQATARRADGEPMFNVSNSIIVRKPLI